MSKGIANRYSTVPVYVKLFQNVQLVIDLKPDLPRSVQTEPDWLLDILLNLLENAYRFTREGTVTLQVSHDAVKGRVVYNVRHHAVGCSCAVLCSPFICIVLARPVAGDGHRAWRARRRATAHVSSVLPRAGRPALSPGQWYVDVWRCVRFAAGA